MADLNRATAADIAGLMGLAEGGAAERWSEAELGAILRHQLDAPLVFDVDAAMVGSTVGHPTAAAADVRCFGDLFAHPRPPLSLLRLAKDFAKAADERAGGPLPSEVATVLYFAAIAAAITRHGEAMSHLDPAAIRDGVRWAGNREWVAEPLRTLLGDPRATGEPSPPA